MLMIRGLKSNLRKFKIRKEVKQPPFFIYISNEMFYNVGGEIRFLSKIGDTLLIIITNICPRYRTFSVFHYISEKLNSILTELLYS